jgi:hypothetical protein
MGDLGHCRTRLHPKAGGLSRRHLVPNPCFRGGPRLVIPAKAGIQRGYSEKDWIPAFAGMTGRRANLDLCYPFERALILLQVSALLANSLEERVAESTFFLGGTV